VLEELRRTTARSGLVEIILVDVWEGQNAREEAQRFCDLWGLRGTVLLDETAEYARSLGVRGVPTNVFVDAEGVVRAVGATTPQELRSELIKLAPGAAAVLGAEPKSAYLSGEGATRGPLVAGDAES
jgi:thioredoxin family protein